MNAKICAGKCELFLLVGRAMGRGLVITQDSKRMCWVTLGWCLRGGKRELGRAFQVGTLVAGILGVKLVGREKWAGIVSLAGGAA